jgi:hypothetical protein
LHYQFVDKQALLSKADERAIKDEGITPQTVTRRTLTTDY